MKKWLLDLQENGDDGTGFNDYRSTCIKCLNDFEEGDLLWATPEGELEGDTHPYCCSCAPNQPNYEEQK